MIDLTELKALAEKATPGPWGAFETSAAIYATNEKIGGDVPVCEIRGYGYLTGKGHGGLGLPHNVAIKRQNDTANFIAAANPATVLEMIAEIERLREALASVRREARKGKPDPDKIFETARAALESRHE